MNQAQIGRKIDLDNTERIRNALERILRPVIRLFVGRVSCNYILQQIKQIYIEEARVWIKSQDKKRSKVTRSRLAMLTGLDTRTIKALEKNIDSNKKGSDLNICAESNVLNGWGTKPEYLDSENRPKIIPISGGAGSFQGLVCSEVGRNVTSKTVLDSLLDSGNVEIIDKNFVRLIDRYYQPIKPSEYVILKVGSNSISRLSQTVAHNISVTDKSKRRLQQQRWLATIPVDKLAEVQGKLDELMRKNILDAEKLLDSYDSPDKEEVSILGAGWYIFG